jgi:flagellar biosynthesis protein FlhF
MQVHSFIAKSAADAVVQIRESLGPAAVVLHVRQMPGLSRLWQQPRIEVLAHLPEEAAAAPAAAPQESADGGCGLEDPARAPFSADDRREETPGPRWGGEFSKASGSEQAMKMLLNSGLLPVAAQAAADLIRCDKSDDRPGTLAETVEQIRHALGRLWKKAPPLVEPGKRPHILVGSPGVGKTTCLCKWLARKVLVEGVSSRVWKLDTATANTAEFLDVYCEILGVPTGRAWSPDGDDTGADLFFIDLPGVDWRSPQALSALARQLQGFGSPRVHLVLNAAYDSALLLEQARAFSVLPVEDLIVTHLDEEVRWGKLWNLMLGTKYSIRYFSDGQNIPGNFHAASAETILARQLPLKQPASRPSAQSSAEMASLLLRKG